MPGIIDLHGVQLLLFGTLLMLVVGGWLRPLGEREECKDCLAVLGTWVMAASMDLTLIFSGY